MSGNMVIRVSQGRRRHTDVATQRQQRQAPRTAERPATGSGRMIQRPWRWGN